MDIVITNIFWKRTYLFIEYTSKKEVEISLAILKKLKKDNDDYVIKKEVLLETKKLDKNKYRSKVNITIAEGRNMLPAGNWRILINHDPNIFPKIDDNVLLNIEDIDRVFRYGQRRVYSYIATFSAKEIIDEETEEKESNICLVLSTSFMKLNKHPFRYNIFTVIWEAYSLKNFLKKSFVLIAKGIINLYYIIVSHLTSKKGKKVLFMSENRVCIMDNLEAIDRRMKERKLDKKFKISYSFRNIFAKKIQNPFEWLKVTTKIASADYIFVDDYVPIFSFLKLHPKQTLVQVWHAGFGFKLVGYGRFGITGSPRPNVSCHRKYTYGLIGNDNLKDIYSEVWGIDKDSLLPTGMPRLEHFLDKDYMDKTINDFYQEYPNLKGKNIVTFAPTYRGFSQRTAYYDYDKIDFDELYKYCKKTNSAILFGKHHFITQDIPIKDEYRDLIYDMSSKKLNDIFYVTNVLITDYSSAFYDYLLLNRPVLFYVYDKALYSATRGVHRPIDNVAPGTVCESFDAIMDALYNKKFEKGNKVNFLTDNCVTNTKLASDQVIDFVILKKGTFEECRKK